jgi:hypothetical protein
MQKFGLEPGKPFDPSKLDPSVVEAIDDAGKDGPEYLAQAMTKLDHAALLAACGGARRDLDAAADETRGLRLRQRRPFVI